jgi:hypothetical protein
LIIPYWRVQCVVSIVNLACASLLLCTIRHKQCLHAQTSLTSSTSSKTSDTTSTTSDNNGSSISNIIGATVLADLRSRGVETSGCSECWQQCDVRHKQTTDSWQYTPAKNKQKLRTQKRNRLAKKLADAAAATATTIDSDTANSEAMTSVGAELPV